MKTLLWIIAALLLSTNFVAFAEHCEDFSSMWWERKTVYRNNDHYENRSYENKKYYKDDYDYNKYEQKVVYIEEPKYIYIKETPVIKKTIDEKKYYSTSYKKTDSKKTKTVIIRNMDYAKDHEIVRKENKKEIDKIVTYYYYKDGSYSYEQAPANTVVVYVPKTSSSYKW